GKRRAGVGERTIGVAPSRWRHRPRPRGLASVGGRDGMSAIDAYLDELFISLRRSNPRDARAFLAEAEAHLRDAAAEGQRQGLSREEAEGAAAPVRARNSVRDRK